MSISSSLTHRDALDLVDITASVADEIVDAVWMGLAKNRNYFHAGRCPSSPAAARSWLLGSPPPRACESCYDLYSLTVAEICTGKIGPRNTDGLTLRDRIAQADNPGGYARRVGTTKATDALRAQNVALYGAAKFDAKTGVAGTVRAALADPWLEELFVLMRKSASESQAVSQDFWPYVRFADALINRSGISADRAHTTVRVDVRRVLEITAQVAGEAWTHDNFVAPRLARQERFADSIHSADDEPREVAATLPSTEEVTSAAVGALVVTALRAGVPVRDAVVGAVNEVAGTAVDAAPELIDELGLFYLVELTVSAVVAILKATEPVLEATAAARSIAAKRATAADLLIVLRHALGACVPAIEKPLAVRVLAVAAKHLR